MRWWKNVFREYFTFEARERRGILALVFVMVFSLALPPLVRVFYKEPKHDFERFKEEIDSFEASLRTGSVSTNDTVEISGFDYDKDPTFDFRSVPEYFNFNPNTATADELHKLGLGNRVSKSIINYRSKGGVFRQKEDLKKIYGLSDSDYFKLAPYIVIPENNAIQKPGGNVEQANDRVATSKKIIDLNHADSLQLVSLPGIGPVLAARIIKYRDRLGGYVRSDQLLEVYGLKPETYEIVKGGVTVDSFSVNKIAINLVTAADLKKHPYFREIAVPIVSYRDQHGTFSTPADLKEVDVVTPDILTKILPYVEFK
jgi:competence ComEA-like helix-hairpin-helix protein